MRNKENKFSPLKKIVLAGAITTTVGLGYLSLRPETEKNLQQTQLIQEEAANVIAFCGVSCGVSCGHTVS